MSNIFEDGEPVDVKKLNDMQIEINELKSTANDAYSLSKTTSESVNILNVTHVKTMRVEFETGLVAKKQDYRDLRFDFNGYTDAFLVATPRHPMYKYDLKYSISGSIGSFRLYVLSDVAINVPVKFDIIAAGIKPKS
jgi:hypothetical protein